jgi:hypothetical protein
VESTVRVNGKLNVTQKCQYAVIPMQQLPSLREAFGADAERYFKPRTKLELTEAAVENRELLAKLIEALGPELFKASFSVKQYAEVTEAFHRDFTLQPDVEAKARPFLDMEAIKAHKASLRQ